MKGVSSSNIISFDMGNFASSKFESVESITKDESVCSAPSVVTLSLFN